MDKAIAKVAPETLQTILDHCEDEVEKLKLIFAANTGMRVGDIIKCSDDEGIKMCQMGKARPASEKAKKPKNRDDLAAKLSTR